MTNDEKIIDMEIRLAVCNEKIARLEAIVYSVAGFAFLSLIGMFVFWIRDFINK